MRIYAPADQMDQVTYASDMGKKVLDYYDSFFGVKYPLPKAGTLTSEKKKKIMTIGHKYSLKRVEKPLLLSFSLLVNGLNPGVSVISLA